MNLDLVTVIAGGSAVLAVGQSVVGTLTRLAWNSREGELNRRIGNLEGLFTKVHNIELKNSQLEGDLKVVHSSHDEIRADIEDIKSTMATKTDMGNLKDMINMVLAELRTRKTGP